MKARNKHAINPLMARCVAHGKSRKATRKQEKLATRVEAAEAVDSIERARFFAMLETEVIAPIPDVSTFDEAVEKAPGGHPLDF